VATVSQSAMLDDAIIQRAAAWYSKQSAVPPAFRGCSPLVLREAKRIAKGDWRRCVVDDDGSITVHNNPVWSRT
jgi:hypothetical protein